MTVPPITASIPAQRLRASGRGMRAGILLCLIVVAWYVVAALAPQLLAPGSPLDIDPAQAYQAPSLAHPFGTDESGRDIYTRVVHGAARSLTIGVVATVIGLALGTLLALVAAFGGRVGDWLSTRLVETLYALPGILLALLLLSLTGPGVVPATIAVGLATAARARVGLRRSRPDSRTKLGLAAVAHRAAERVRAAVRTRDTRHRPGRRLGCRAELLGPRRSPAERRVGSHAQRRSDVFARRWLVDVGVPWRRDRARRRDRHAARPICRGRGEEIAMTLQVQGPLRRFGRCVEAESRRPR